MENYKASDEKCGESELPPRQAQQIDEPEISYDDEYEKPKISSEPVPVKATRSRLATLFRQNASKAGKKRFKSTPRIKRKSYKIKRKREIFREALTNSKDTMILVATLIATFTYNAGINPPGGLYQDGLLIGTAVAARITAFRVFTVCNNLALFLAIFVVFILVSFIPTERRLIRRTLFLSYKFVWAAIYSMSAAYVASIVVIMKPAPPRKGLAWTTVFLLCVCACLLGSMMLPTGILVVSNLLRKVLRKRASPRQIKERREEQQLVETSSDSDES